MPTSLYIDEIAIIALSGLLAWAAVHDLRTYTIPNWLCAAVALLFVVHALSTPYPVNWINSLIAGVMMFLAGLALFGANLMGGGDVKLMVALGLWTGLHSIMQFLLVTSLAGGVLALVIGSRHWFSRVPASGARVSGSGDQATVGSESVRNLALPYGVAIACGGLFVAARLFPQ